MLVYFGITDPEEDGRGVREAGRRPARGDEGLFDDPDDGPGRPSTSRSRRTPTRSGSAAGVGVVPPRTFNDAQKIADQFKQGVPVIVNFQQTDTDLSKRLIDFASGLTYGLDGAMQRIADKVFLLIPPGVDVSAEERAALLEGGFFNQS